MKTRFILSLFLLVTVSQAADRGMLAPVARRKFQEIIAPLFEGRISVEDFEVSVPARTVTLRHLIISSPPGFGSQPMLTVETVYLKVAPMLLLKHQFLVTEVQISEPVVICYQRPDGRLNLASELMRLVKTKTPSSEPAVSLSIERVSLKNAQLQFISPSVNPGQPVFTLDAVQAELSNIVLPNHHSVRSPFSLQGILRATHRGQISSRGEVTLGVSPVSFTADADIQGLFLEDFVYLYPQAPVTPASGFAVIRSHFTCWGTYLENINHVEITGLQLKSKGGLAGQLFLGLPAAALAKVLQDETATIKLDFEVRGPFEELKTDLKNAIGAALQRNFKEKFSGKIASTVDTLKKKVTEIFRRKKD